MGTLEGPIYHSNLTSHHHDTRYFAKDETIQLIHENIPTSLITIVEDTLIADGINTIFATTSNFRPGTTQLFYNGLKESHYTEISNNHISLGFMPSINGMIDELIIKYEVL